MTLILSNPIAKSNLTLTQRIATLEAEIENRQSQIAALKREIKQDAEKRGIPHAGLCMKRARTWGIISRVVMPGENPHSPDGWVEYHYYNGIKPSHNACSHADFTSGKAKVVSRDEYLPHMGGNSMWTYLERS